MSATTTSYALRGNRVERLDLQEIQARAEAFCSYFKVNKKTKANMAWFLECLSEEKICIDPVADKDWFFVTDGICTPENFTIRIPDSTYVRICEGDPRAIELIFHELGHLILAHKIVLHNDKSAPVSMEEDAEWQADSFSAYVMRRMNLQMHKQLSLVFGS